MSRAGIIQIAMCDLGTLATTPANPILLGIGGEKSLIISPHKQIDLFPDKKGRNMENHKAEGLSNQASMLVLSSLINFLNFNADVQIITTKQSADANSEDVLQYVGNNVFGLDFEYEVGADKRGVKITLERAFEYLVSKTLIDAADSNTAKAFTGITDVGGRDFSKYRPPYFLAAESPAGTALFNPMSINSRKLTIKTKNSKNIYNASIVDMLQFNLEIVATEASIAKFITEMNKAEGSKFLWKEGNGGTNYDGFDFNTNVLTQSDEKTISDKERIIKATFSGSEWISNISWDLEVSGGGAAAGDGSVGGTMKIGY